jgi:hypothetical protein
MYGASPIYETFTVTATWGARITAYEAYRRAGGRRALNARRRFQAGERQVQVAQRIAQLGLQHGVRARIALELGVHPSTIGRDIQRIFGDRGPRQGMSAS